VTPVRSLIVIVWLCASVSAFAGAKTPLKCKTAPGGEAYYEAPPTPGSPGMVHLVFPKTHPDTKGVYNLAHSCLEEAVKLHGDISLMAQAWDSSENMIPLAKGKNFLLYEPSAKKIRLYDVN
jgi:hypothetical protein